MIAQQKKTMLRIIYFIRQWLTTLKDSTALLVEISKLNIQLKYKKLIRNIYLN